MVPTFSEIKGRKYEDATEKGVSKLTQTELYPNVVPNPLTPALMGTVLSLHRPRPDPIGCLTPIYYEDGTYQRLLLVEGLVAETT